MSSLPYLKHKRKIFKAEVLDAAFHDGDTPKLFIGFGFGAYESIKLRLQNYDAPELTSHNPMEKEVAKMSLEASQKIYEYSKTDLIEVESRQKRTHDRYEGDLYLYKLGCFLTEILVKINLGRLSLLTKRVPWMDGELHDISENYDKFIQNPQDFYDFFLIRKSNSIMDL